MKNKFVLLFSCLFSLFFLFSIFKLTYDYANIEANLVKSPNVVDIKNSLVTHLKVGPELNDNSWIKLDFNDSNWKKIRLPDYTIASESDYAAGNFAYYRILVPAKAIAELSHLKNEIALALQYINFSEAQIFVNGQMFMTIRPNQVSESLINIPIKENQDNLVAIRGSIAPGNSGIQHRGYLLVGKTGELNELYLKSYKLGAVFGIIFYICKGSILFIFTLIFLVLKVEKYFEHFLIFAMLLVTEEIVLTDQFIEIFSFDIQVLVYNILAIGIISYLYLFLSDVTGKKADRKSILWVMGILSALSFTIALDALYFGNYFNINNFLQFWRTAQLCILLYFLPQLWKKDKLISIVMIISIFLVVLSIVIVKIDFKAHANLLLFFMIGYETFVLFRKDQTLLSERENQLREQEKDVAIGQTAAILAHDVRRPLEQMKLLLNRLSLGDTSEEFIKAASRDVDYSITSAHNMVNEIMNFSRTKTLDLAPTSFYKVLSGALRQVLPINTNVKLNIEYRFHTHVQILGEESGLSGVLTNLISNAVEAIRDIGKRSEGKLILTTEQKGDDFIFTIFNDGPTIPESILPDIMRPLFTHGKKQGTGLGLASVAKIVREHGGQLSVRNVANAGVEFTFNLKAGTENDKIDMNEFKAKSSDYFYSETKKTIADQTKTLRIFLLDDDKQVYEYFHHLVQNLGYDVELSYAHNVEEGVNMIRAKRFDLYILDFDLETSATTGLDFYHQYLSFLSREVVLHTNRDGSQFKNEKCRYQMKPMALDYLQHVVKDIDQQRLKVLLVEDSELTSMVWELYHGKHNIVTMKSPEDALEYVKSGAPIDVCVIDYYFDNSKMNGVELADTVKVLRPGLNIVISSNGNVETTYQSIPKDHFEIRNL